MTNSWNDIENSDYILVIAGNPAENHPAAYGHITIAMEKGAKLLVVDPRFTRSASKATLYCPIRSGTDVAFIGGVIKYVMDDMEVHPENYNMTYINQYTNFTFLVNPSYQGPPDLDGLFSGYNPSGRTYDKSTWTYQYEDGSNVPKRADNLQDPNCVFQIVKKHFARFTPEMVNKISGAPQEKFLEVAQTFAQSGAVGKSGTIMYAMGATHHTIGTQIIRSYAILQLLLGNIGVAGGGIQAMRGESNVQGSTDQALLSNNLPGYLNMTQHTDQSLQTYLNRVTPVTRGPVSLNWWQNTPKYAVSLLKAWWGEVATADNEFAFHNLPKPHAGKNYTHIALFEAMGKGDIKGLMCWGQNPAVGSPNAGQTRTALANLDWLLCIDLWETETSVFWKRPDLTLEETQAIQTEVVLLPALASFEKEGSVTNSARWMQWRYKCADGPPEARADLEIINELMTRIRALYEQDSAAPGRDIVGNLTWDSENYNDPSVVAKELNGYDLTTGKLMASFANLKSDGTTSSGNWIYCNSYVEQESLDAFEKANLDMWIDPKYVGNRAARRYTVDVGNGGYNADAGYKDIGLHSYWAWCWPLNRRIIYNRCSVDLDGAPFDTKRPIHLWDNAGAKWVGDVPDGGGKPMNQGGHLPLIMRSDGVGSLFTANLGTREASLADGPLPEHYEPWESPLAVNPLSGTKISPVITIWHPDEQGTPDEYPIVATTYRVVEHWQAGQMTRNLPWLVEQMPNMFAELSEELAARKGIANGEEVIIWNKRGQIKAVALVTKRFKPFQLNGTQVDQIGMVWHFGYVGLATGDSANLLTPTIGDPNTTIPEYKAFLCDVRKA